MSEPVPKEVEIRDEAAEPTTDSTLGVPLDTPAAPGTPRNRLVVIGDSLSHGFQSAAIFNTNLSYPAIIAWELGCYDDFRFPSYPAFGGVPLNLEFLIADLEHHLGSEVSWWESPLALYRVRQHLAEAEAWWDKGPGSEPLPSAGINHNLGIYGWDLRDALDRTAATAEAEWQPPDGFHLVPLIRNADAIAAIRVLGSAVGSGGEALTPFGAAAALGAEGVEEGPAPDGDPGDGIETLIVFLGANNALGSVISLSVRWSGDGYDEIGKKAAFNVWRPSHFEAELNRVAAEVKKVRARHVIFGTVPHVTIAPIARGVGGKVSPGSRFFRYYTRPWISDRDFDPAEDGPYLTADDARAVDSAIDQYNAAIRATVAAARREGRDWRLLDVCGLLDRLAARRYIDDPQMTPPSWWTPYELPGELAALTPVPDTRFFAAGTGGRTAGGLVSLDGIHPTTIAYGILANEFMKVMGEAGVVFRDPAGAPREDPGVDFKRLVALDSLISKPPASLSSDVALIGWCDQRIDVFRRLWPGAG
ncbi:MAG TPA: hypothetical protein VFR04_00405 [Solirubrobacterales bacterium]|nr:hypothetical protein [Solirubrobacterales bacterium]